MLEQPLCYPLKSSAKDLPNEVRPDTFFQLRQTKHFFTHSNTLDQKCHIISKCSHNLKALSILLCLICVIAMNAVPVLAGCYRHTGDCEKFVELIKRCRTSASSCRHYRSTNFHTFIKVCTVKQSGQARHKRCIGRGIIYRTSNYQTIRFLKLWCNFIDNVINNTFTGFCASPTSHTTAYRQVTDLYNFCVHAVAF